MTTTTQPGSPLQPSDVPLVEILVRYEPKNRDEEELLVAAQQLLAKLYPLTHDARFVEAEYREVYDTNAAAELIAINRKRREEGRDSMPGPEDRMVIESVTRTSTDEGVLVTCDYDTAISYKRDAQGVRSVDNDRKSSTRYTKTLVKTTDGWRVATNSIAEKFPSENVCAS